MGKDKEQQTIVDVMKEDYVYNPKFDPEYTACKILELVERCMPDCGNDTDTGYCPFEGKEVDCKACGIIQKYIRQNLSNLKEK